jgi:hypothetical protein
MSQNIDLNFDERIEAINAQAADLQERRKVALQITEKSIAKEAADRASKERAVDTDKFLLEQRRNISQEIVEVNLTKAEEDRIQREGYRPTADQPVRPITFSNSSGPNPPEAPPTHKQKFWEWRQR